ncbi:myozenin-1 isoform X1 [Rhineura floridana]|uniref:myozenin-1 isoform X1 n=2 Tax=Rhineura floridana TaxID=261503 RepID=UPI002AC83552|nr:myozenin-1 isoform X1 [Rhineura floridana]XP_061490592.1 myozenin-1 isoform X1 [Rhineura floridana]XP_061490593.1 myozenin-1 isoform X1 [Rhineura floridana]
MPLAGTPAPLKKRKPTKLILELTQEVMPQEGSKLNLGKKISIPRDVMLEELSLLTNRGSKMFKLRQLRVEKFIYENNPDVFTDNSVDHFQRFIPSVGGHYGVDSHGFSHSSGRMVGGVTVGRYGSSKLQYPPAPPPKPGSKGGAGGTGAGHTEGSAGTGGVDGGGGSETTGGKGDSKGGSGKHVTIFKTYISPWERALGLTPQEKSELTDLLSYGTKAELCHYKSFNRSAMPYGGYEKAIKLMTFQMPKFDAGPLVPEPVIVYNQEVTNRPSFNRTPVPWQGSGEPTAYNIEVSMPLAGETEEL